MAKALKVAAVVVGVAALAVVTGGAALGLGVALSTSAFGVSAGALLLTSTALSTGAALLTKKPSVTAAQTERLFANIDPRAFRKTPLGRTALPIDVRYEEFSGKDQEYCDWIVAHASCAIDGVEAIYFDTELAWTPAGGTVGRYAGYFSVPNLVLEGSPANAFSFGAGKWNGSSRLTGCAYARWRFKLTGNGKKGESPFASGIPNRITVVGRGAKLYDPRRDSTVPGGSGPMRAADQSTWRFTADDGGVIGNNLPLQVLRVVLGWRIRNPFTGEMRLATGSGVPARRLRLTSWITSANLADERVNRSAGGTEPRYQGAAVVSEGDDPRTTLDMLAAGCCGRFRDTSGKLSFDIAHNDLASAATEEGLLDDDVVGAFTWDPDPGLEAAPNVVRGRYVDASVNSLYQLVDYPEVRIPSPDGIERIFSLDLGAVESASQAQRVVKQGLQRKQYQRRFSAPFDIRAWKYEVGSLLPFTFAPLSFARVLFRVEAQELGQGGVCNMTLSFEHPAIYAFDGDDRAAVQAAAPIVYDSRNNPLILAIDEAATTAVWDNVDDPNGTKPEDNATVGAPIDSNIGGRPVRAVLETIDKIEPIAATYPVLADDVSALKGAKVGTDAALAALDRASVDHAAALAQAERDAGRIGETLLRLLAESDRTRTFLRDAGIVVDPVTGVVRIYAVEQLRERTASAEIRLDAATATISSKASVSYVNEQIARAVLDPAQAAQLEPIIARLTSVEQIADGARAALATKAELVELTRVSGRLTTVSQNLDALAGTVSTKASRTDVDAQGVRIGLVEETLSTLDGVSRFGVTVRQARAVADGAAEAGLRALLAGDEASRRQIVQQAEVRSEMIAKLGDQATADAAARTVLSVRIGATDARAVQETTARIAGDTALARDIDALSVTNGQQAAAIATLTDASIVAGRGIAGITTTIRQQAGAADTTAEGLLRALIAGDETGRARAAQLVQVQTEFTTTLVANERASAVARQALVARMAAAEAAIVTTSRVLADMTRSLVEQITALEAVIAHPTTGLAAARGEIVRVDTASAKRDEVIVDSVEALSAQVNNEATGLPATRAQMVIDRKAVADGDSANIKAIEAIEATVNNPVTGLAAAHAGVGSATKAIADGDKALGERIDSVVSRLGTAEGSVADVQRAITDGDEVLAESIRQVTTTLDGQTSSVDFLLRAIDGTEAIAQLSVTAGGKVTGFRVDGVERDFAVDAKRFFVGDTQIFSVDAETGITTIANAAIGVASIDTLNLKDGSITSQMVGTLPGFTIAMAGAGTGTRTVDSDPIGTTTTGRRVRIDVQLDSRTEQDARFIASVRLWRATSAGVVAVGRIVPIGSADASYGWWVIDTPAAGDVSYFLRADLNKTTNGLAQIDFSSIQIAIEETKK